MGKCGANMNFAATDTIALCLSCGKALCAPTPVGGTPVQLARCKDCEHRYYISVLPEPPKAVVTGEQAARGFSPLRHLASSQTPVQSIPCLLYTSDAADE